MRQVCQNRDSLWNRQPRVPISGSHDGCITVCVVCGYQGPRAVPTELPWPTLVCVYTMEINSNLTSPTIIIAYVNVLLTQN